MVAGQRYPWLIVLGHFVLNTLLGENEGKPTDKSCGSDIIPLSSKLDTSERYFSPYGTSVGIFSYLECGCGTMYLRENKIFLRSSIFGGEGAEHFKLQNMLSMEQQSACLCEQANLWTLAVILTLSLAKLHSSHGWVNGENQIKAHKTVCNPREEHFSTCSIEPQALQIGLLHGKG